MRSREHEFNELAGSLTYSMFIVTAAAGERRGGCLVGFAAQCSISPSRFMVWLSKQNYTYGVARETSVLGVHALTRDTFELARLFGTETGHDTDKFARCAWHPDQHGLPLLEDCGTRFAGEVLAAHDTGDHVGFLLRPLTVSLDQRRRPRLTIDDVKDLTPGHEA
ncbi:MAG TPA: flavin reductase family protein [Amycolatopsis sp.]|nr:flavin reductase family protein [Amycolatopsis sp.]